MQGIHSIGGGRFLTGGGDRRLRPHHQAALKCPRCDSLNTKFCYYNNYNLSQPRHFCKSCRRYWTKGGVLRNVPVGGGCRKSKRSKPKTDGERKPNRSSSSESSSLTAATTAGAAEEGALPTNMVHEFADPSKFLNTLPLDHHQSTMDGQIFTNEMMGYGMGADVKTTSYQGTGLVGTTGAVNDDGLAAALDWGSGGCGDQGFFDLTAAVDPAYWSDPSHWTDNNDQSLNYLP